MTKIRVQNEIRAAADVPTLFATLGGKKGDELSENKNRAAKWQKRPHHALIVAGRVKKRNLRKESDTPTTKNKTINKIINES